MNSTTTYHSDQLEFFAESSTRYCVSPVSVLDPVQSRARTTDPETSHASASNKSEQIKRGTQRHRLLYEYAQAKDLTDEEAGMRSGLHMARACYWKRCGELRDLGLISDCGYTRKSFVGHDVMVCGITKSGVEMLEVIGPP